MYPSLRLLENDFKIKILIPDKPIPISVSIGSYKHMINAKNIILITSRKLFANCPEIKLATLLLVPTLLPISPGWRCVKKLIGKLNTCQKKAAEVTRSILLYVFNKYLYLIFSRKKRKLNVIAIPAINGHNQSLEPLIRILSTKIFEKLGMINPGIIYLLTLPIKDFQIPLFQMCSKV
jgi:hypothetical protein